MLLILDYNVSELLWYRTCKYDAENILRGRKIRRLSGYMSTYAVGFATTSAYDGFCDVSRSSSSRSRHSQGSLTDGSGSS